MNKHGDFIWYELMTKNADAAQQFYSALLGWHFSDSGQADKDYRIFHAIDRATDEPIPIGGLMQLTEAMEQGGARPLWLGYIAVDNVDDCLHPITARGGKVLLPAFDLPDVGRIAMVSDPQGLPFYIMCGRSDYTSLAFSEDKPRSGHCAWNELVTPDPKSAMSFYSQTFGWQKDGEMDMGEMGAYEFLRHGSLIGAMMRKPAAMPSPIWNHYFRVEDIEAAVGNISQNGGQVLMGPMEIPGGELIIQGIDPQGAMFALVGQRTG